MKYHFRDPDVLKSCIIDNTHLGNWFIIYNQYVYTPINNFLNH